MNDQAQSLRELVKKTGNSGRTAPKTLRPPAKVICITSGKGGVGKSFFTVNLALALQQLGLAVMIIDADFGLANVDIMLGMPSRYNLSHLLSHEHTLAEIVQEWRGGIKFISGGNGIGELLQMNEKQLAQIVDDLMLLNEPVDIILCDTGAGAGETVLRMAAAASETILVTTPEPTSLLDAYALLKALSQDSGAPSIRLVMNKAVSKNEAENAINSFLGITKKYLNKQVAPLGSILYDDEVARSIKQQIPLLIAQPQNAAVRDIVTIAAALAGLPAERKPAGQLAKLFSRWLKQA